MSVREIDGFLHLDFRYKERRYRPSTKLIPTEQNRKFCDDWDATIRREIAIGTFDMAKHFPSYAKAAPGAVVTFKDDADAWLAAHKSTWARLTYQKFEHDLQVRVYPAKIPIEAGSKETRAFGEWITKELRPKDLRALREALAADGRLDGEGKVSNQTINKFIQPVKAVLLELFSDGELEMYPVPRRFELKEKRITEIDHYTDEELTKLFKAVRRPEYRHYEEYVNFIFESGFRPEENNGMQWPRVDLAGGTYHVREVFTAGELERRAKTEFALRDTEITAGMARWLKRQKAKSYLRSPFVWVTVRGRPIEESNFIRNVWRPLHQVAHVNYRYPQQARHTWATRHIMRGTDPRWMVIQMGTSLEMLFKQYTAAFNRAREGKNKAEAAARGQVYGQGRK